MTEVSETTTSGWDAVQLVTDQLAVTIVPGKGADITSIRARDHGIELLWSPRWGLRPPTALPLPGSQDAVALDRSGGGWHTLFPNAGRASVEYGVEWGFHGEAWLAPFHWSRVTGGVRCTTALARSPFTVEKTITIDGAAVSVRESVTHVGARLVDVLWCQHPTFGAPLVGPDIEVEITGCVVHPDMVDDVLPTQAPPRWPRHVGERGQLEDLSRLDAAGSGGARLAFLGSFDDEDVRATVRNAVLGLEVELAWKRSEFPFAWYWYESGGRQNYPWFGAEHALALEPATGYPSGLARARALTDTATTIAPGETVTKTVTMTLR